MKAVGSVDCVDGVECAAVGFEVLVAEENVKAALQLYDKGAMPGD